MELKTNPKFLKEIQEGGCLYLSLVYIAQLILGKEFTIDEINRTFYRLKVGKVIGDGCFIRNHDKILSAFGVTTYRIKLTPANTIAVPVPYALLPGEFAIAEFYHPVTKLTHFVNVDVTGTVTYDSLGLRPDGKPVSKCRREGVLRSLRVYKYVA